jgi:ribonuclease Y
VLALDQNIWFGIAGLLLGVLFALSIVWVRRKQQRTEIELAENAAARIIEEAKRDAGAIKKEAEIQVKDSLIKEKMDFEKEVRETRREIQAFEKRLVSKEEALDKRVDSVEKRDSDLGRREAAIKSREKSIEDKSVECDRQVDEARKQLEQVAGMTREEAKRNLIDQMVEEAKHDSAKRIRVVEEGAKEEAVRKSQKIIALAIERLAGDFVAERSVTVVALPNDELKGKIIGREGRNIRALEAATGIDLIVDDTPETVVISGHNPIRREVARLSLEKLISDGRIHPGRIEEVVRKSEQELEEAIREAGQKAIFDVGVHGVHPEIIKLLGRAKCPASFHRGGVYLRHDGVGAGLERKTGSARGAAPRYRQGGGPRGGGIPCDHRRRTRAQIWRVAQNRQCHSRAPRRRESGNDSSASGRCGGCAIGRATRGTPRNDGKLCAPARRAGEDYKFVQGGGKVLRGSSGSRGPHHGAA